jgi:hypothetical protein
MIKDRIAEKTIVRAYALTGVSPEISKITTAGVGLKE